MTTAELIAKLSLGYVAAALAALDGGARRHLCASVRVP